MVNSACALVPIRVRGVFRCLRLGAGGVYTICYLVSNAYIRMGSEGFAVAAVFKSMLVAAALSLVGFGATGTILTKPLWAKERPLYVGDFGPRLVSSNGDFVLPNHSRVQWTIRSYRSLGADSSPRQPMDCGVSSYRSSAQLKNAMRVHTVSMSLGQLDRKVKNGRARAKSSSDDGRFHFPLNYYKIEAAPSNSH